MATIQLTDDWRIQSEAHSWALAKKTRIKNKKTGEKEDTWIAQSWHVDPESAGKYWADEQARSANTHSFDQLQAERLRLKSLLARAGLMG